MWNDRDKKATQECLSIVANSMKFAGIISFQLSGRLTQEESSVKLTRKAIIPGRQCTIG